MGPFNFQIVDLPSIPNGELPAETIQVLHYDIPFGDDIYIGGSLIANVKKKFAFFKNDFVITSPEGQYYVQGNIWAREFEIFRDNILVAHISKEFFSFTDTYGVDIDDNIDQVQTLALAIVIDMVCHDDKK